MYKSEHMPLSTGGAHVCSGSMQSMVSKCQLTAARQGIFEEIVEPALHEYGCLRDLSQSTIVLSSGSVS